MSTMGYVSTLKGAGASGALNLDFSTQEYAIQGSKRNFSDIITFTRATAGGRFGRGGEFEMVPVNQPRLDHDPSTGQLIGILVEEPRTNLLLKSSEFDDSYWNKTRSSITPNTVISPDGTLTADKLVEDSTSGGHSTSRAFTPTQDKTYTFSVFVKAAERTIAEVWWGGFANQVAPSNIVLDLISGVYTYTAADSTRTSVQKCKDGWWRVSTTTTSSNGVSISLTVSARANTQSANYQGDGVSGIYIWGAQVEEGAFPTSHIPTTTTEVTRAVDIATVPTLSPWWNPVEGTMFIDYSPNTNITTSVIGLSMSSSATTKSAVRLTNTGTDARGFITKEDGTTMLNSGISVGSANRIKSAVGMILDDMVLASEGKVSTRVRATEMPVPTSFRIGALASNAGALNGHVRSVVYFPARLPNELLQLLTSN